MDGKAPREVRLPIAVQIETFHDDGLGPIGHLGVAARVWTRKPFGLNYYVNPGLLTDERISAQVLGLEHERFIRQLVKFLEKTEKKEEKK